MLIMLWQQHLHAQHLLIIMQVAADTFLYTPLNVGLFFALMTVVEGGHWQVQAGGLINVLFCFSQCILHVKS